MSEEICWEYQVSGNNWTRYEKEIVDFLNRQPKDTETCERAIKDCTVEFDFKKMQINNVESKSKRSIRCVLKSDEDDLKYITWEYMSGRKYQSFPPNVLSALEKAWMLQDEDDDQDAVDVQLYGEKAVVDLSKNVILFANGNKSVKVRRQELKAVFDDAADQPVPKQGSSQQKDRAERISVAKSVVETKQAKKSKSKKEVAEQKNKKVVKNTSKKIVIEADDDEEEGAELDEIDGKENDTETTKDDEQDEKRGSKRKIDDVAEDSGFEADVDIECVQKLGKASVYSEGKDIYDVMLNQTNIQNNNNKFFVLQVLKDDVGVNYSTWFRWGRVGFTGQSSLTSHGNNLVAALNLFKRKFKEKTSNGFDERENFNKVNGKYDMIRVEYTKKKRLEVESPKGKGGLKSKRETIIESKLEPGVFRLMQLICDLKTMEKEIRTMEYDTNKSPLGKVTKEQIKAGYEALSEIENYIKAGTFGAEFNDAVNAYYTRIPHCFGMRPPTSIRTIAQLKVEINLLETLCGIEIAITAINEEKKKLEQKELHPLDKQYFNLTWCVTPLNPKDKMVELIDRYLQSTHGSTHDRYKMKLKNVFELKEREGFERAFNGALGNRKLLWHGSRISNWYGILSQGLRIAPPEAPVTGYMFGKGVYFADASSKSANYTYPEPGKPGFLVLAEVALGNMNELTQADEKASNLPKGCDSVRGVGRRMPNPKQSVTLEDGLVVPCGKLVEESRYNGNALSLLYNEFIVYNTNQIREKYLVEVDFDFGFDV